MNRWLLAAVLGVSFLGAVQAQDTISYKDRAQKKNVDVTGTIEEETPVGIKIKSKGKEETRLITPDDVVQINYKVPGLSPADFRKPFVLESKALRSTRTKERVEGLDKAIEAFKELEKELRGNSNARRYIQYKEAQLVVVQAQEEPTKVEDAIKALTAYKTANMGGWEIVPALKQLARLQEDTGKGDEARKTYEELADLADVPKEIKQESELLVSKLLLRGGKYADAEKRLRSLSGSLPADDPQRAFIQAYLTDSQIGQGNLAQAETQLNEALKVNPDPKLRGGVHNLLGDYFRKKGQNEEAFWHYLRVDSLYNEDAEEQAKALYQLSTLFDKVKRDPIRARECATRLQDKRFQGTTFQKLSAAEDKKAP